jgi:hypothetical protein
MEVTMKAYLVYRRFHRNDEKSILLDKLFDSDEKANAYIKKEEIVTAVKREVYDKLGITKVEFMKKEMDVL